MKYQDYIIDQIQKSMDAAFREAKAMPADKLTWKPLDEGRSALDQIQELAQCSDYVVGTLAGKVDDHNPERWQQIMAERQAWDTVEKCEAVAKERLDKLFAIIRDYPDDKLNNTVWLPYDGGRDFTMIEMMNYPRWNADYHAGQISYIQTLYGDKDMH